MEKIINDNTAEQNNTPDTTAPVSNERPNISGGQLWEELKQGISEMTVDLKFNNNQ